MSKKHMAVSGNRNATMSDWIFRILVVMTAVFMIGWGENYVAQKEAEVRLEEAAQHEEIVNDFNDALDAYKATLSYPFKCDVEVVDDGINVNTWAREGKVVTKAHAHMSWEEVVEETSKMRAKTNAALYSF